MIEVKDLRKDFGGAEVLKEHNPAVPYTVEEMVREAKSAYKAGASITVRYVSGS